MLNEETRLALYDTARFVLEIDKLKGVLRKVKPIGQDRYENTAEHSWQIAAFALSMARSLAYPIQVDRVLAMLLVHDIGEIDAGDKFVFADDGWEERKLAELRAVERIFGLAPPNVATTFLDLWKEFEAGETPEAKFAKAIDRSMPVLLNLSNGGGSWVENGVSYQRVVSRIQPEIENGCPELWTYLKAELDKARGSGFFAIGSK
ncbi:HD family hydrolase [Terriglobus sp. 2YAB30_2]|uniref:HD domain-containing protein n=1 Tax=unclassified Terriglobus TaxID=2628988 RepID=UPI003F9ACBEA